MNARLCCLLLLLAAPALAAEAQNRVAVVPYSGAGRDPEFVSSLATALRSTLAERTWPVADAAETERHVRAATMCGEDVECLSTIGQRIDARWVLAFGVGRVGGNLMVSALLVDASVGLKHMVFTETLAAPPPDFAALARRSCDVLLVGVTPPSKLAPPDVPKPDQPPLIVAPATPPHPLRPWAIGTAIGAGGLAIAGGTFTVLAQQGFSRLPDVALAQRPAADASQRTLNLTADILVGAAIAAGATALVLFILDGREAPPAAGATP